MCSAYVLLWRLVPIIRYCRDLSYPWSWERPGSLPPLMFFAAQFRHSTLSRSSRCLTQSLSVGKKGSRNRLRKSSFGPVNNRKSIQQRHCTSVMNFRRESFHPSSSYFEGPTPFPCGPHVSLIPGRPSSCASAEGPFPSLNIESPLFVFLLPPPLWRGFPSSRGPCASRIPTGSGNLLNPWIRSPKRRHHDR